MPEPLDDLRDALREVPVRPLPAAEVRRLGDRRRRTVALAAAGAALAVALPLSLTARSPGDVIDPGGTKTAPSTSVVRIPQDFPLSLGWPDDVTEQPCGPTCDPAAPSAGLRDVDLTEGLVDFRLDNARQGSQISETRWLLLYPDADAATAMSNEVKAGVEGSSVDDLFALPGVGPAESGTGSEMSAYVYGRAEPGRASAYVVYRAGNAILLAERTVQGDGLAVSALPKIATTLLTGSRDLYATQLCRFTRSGCGATGRTSAPLPAQKTDPDTLDAYTPEYFAHLSLSAGLAGDDFSVTPLDDSVDLCGHRITPVRSPATTHAVAHIGGGLTDSDRGTVTRDIAVYATSADAQEPYDAIASALLSCDLETSKAMSGGGHLIEPLPVDDGVAWLRTERDAAGTGATTGQEVWVATVSGRTLLVQHEAVAAVPASQKHAREQADALIAHAERLSAALAEL